MLSITKVFQVTKAIINPRFAASCQFHSSNSLSATIEEKLGIPARPKKPLTPYFRFLVDNRSKLHSENPNLKPIEIVQLCAKKYASINPELKNKYQDEYHKEHEEYIKKRAAYENKLTAEQRLEISNAKQDVADRKLRIDYKRRLKENQKPKKPPSGFLRYLRSAADTFPRKESQTYREWQSSVAAEWNKLSDEQKKSYNDASHSEFIKYKQEIAKWELKMIRLGQIDLVREETLIEHENNLKPKRSTKPKVSRSVSDSD